VIVRIVVLWIMATFAVVLLAGQAFDRIADDVSVRRPAPMTRTEVAEQLRARLGQGGPPSSTSEPAGQGDGQGDGQSDVQTPPPPGTTGGSGPNATTGGPDSTLSTGEGGGRGTSGSGADPGGAVTSSTTSDQADPAQP
jgi:hypothetical protein